MKNENGVYSKKCIFHSMVHEKLKRKYGGILEPWGKAAGDQVARSGLSFPHSYRVNALAVPPNQEVEQGLQICKIRIKIPDGFRRVELVQ